MDQALATRLDQALALAAWNMEANPLIPVRRASPGYLSQHNA